MLTIGLTGGIGSGKSTVANFFQELGVDVIDSDILARELTETFQPAYSAILSRFGKSVVTKQGDLDRKALREIIFNDPIQKQWLEELLHPFIKQKITEAIAQSTSPYVIVVIPLLVESGMASVFDRILVVDSTTSKQLERTLNRDELQEDTVLKIINSQATREQRLAIATDVILNDLDLTHLKNEVAKLHHYYLQLAKS